MLRVREREDFAFPSEVPRVVEGQSSSNDLPMITSRMEMESGGGASRCVVLVNLLNKDGC